MRAAVAHANSAGDVRVDRGFVSKDTVAGGFGSRLRPFSKVTRVVAGLKRHFHDLPSVHLAYCAAIARRGHELPSPPPLSTATSHRAVVARDYRRERPGHGRCGRRGVARRLHRARRQMLPQLFDADADFIIDGEPEAAMMRLARASAERPRQEPELSNLTHCLPWWIPLVADRFGMRVAGLRGVPGRIGPGARVAELSGVLHLLPAPHSSAIPGALGG